MSTRKIVINDCYGGFGLSEEATAMLNLTGLDEIRRDDARLIQILEERGSEYVSGKMAHLKIVEIPEDVDWVICEYDGVEWVAERHRVWS